MSGWLRHNLFSSLPSSVATIVVGGLLVAGLVLVAEWALADARWGVITTNMRLFANPRHPYTQRLIRSVPSIKQRTGIPEDALTTDAERLQWMVEAKPLAEVSPGHYLRLVNDTA